MTARYEDRAWRIQREINELTEKQAECERAVERAKDRLGEPPPSLRDRNGFFNVLLHGERAVLEQKAPLWQGFRRSKRECRQIKKQLGAKTRKIDRIIRQGVAASGWRAKLAREKGARRSCEQLLKAIGQARRRINRSIKSNPRAETSRLAVDEEVTEVSKLMKVVRECVDDVDRKTRPHRSFDASDTLRIEIEFPRGDGDHKLRARKYQETKAALDSIETRAKYIISELDKREKDLQAQLHLAIANERARFNETPPPSL